MTDPDARDTSARPSTGRVDDAVVRATKLTAGLISLGAAGLSSLLRADERPRSAPGGAAPQTDDPPPAVAATLVALVELERWAALGGRIAGGMVKTAAATARLARLGRWVDAAADRMSSLGEVGRADAAEGAARADAALEAVLEAAVRRVLPLVDVDAIADRIDVDRIVRRVDVDAIVDRIDLEALVRRLDLAGIGREVLDEIGVDEIIRESSGSLVVQTVDVLRSRGADADRQVASVVDRILQRRRARDVVVETDAEATVPDDVPSEAAT